MMKSSSENWVLDGHALHHFTSDSKLLHDIQLVDKPRQKVFLPNGKIASVLGRGSVRTEQFNIPGVLFVPDLGHGINVVSVERLVHDHDLVVNFYSSHALVHDLATEQLIGKGRRSTSDGLYVLDYLLIGQESDQARANAGELYRSSENHEWVLDSGAWLHHTSDARLLVDLHLHEMEMKSTAKDYLPRGDGVLPILGRGSVRTVSLQFPGVCYVEGDTKNAISVRQLSRDHGLTTVFESTKCYVRDRTTGRNVGHGRFRNGNYVLDTLVVGQQYYIEEEVVWLYKMSASYIARDDGAGEGGPHKGRGDDGGGEGGNEGGPGEEGDDGDGGEGSVVKDHEGGASSGGGGGDDEEEEEEKGEDDDEDEEDKEEEKGEDDDDDEEEEKEKGRDDDDDDEDGGDNREQGDGTKDFRFLGGSGGTGAKKCKGRGVSDEESSQVHSRMYGLSRDMARDANGDVRYDLPPEAFPVAASSNEVRKREFLVDSGASLHVTWDEQTLFHYPDDLHNQTKPPLRAFGGVGPGSITVTRSGYLNGDNIMLDGIMLAPASRKNLVSVGQLTHQYGAIVQFDDEDVVIITRKLDGIRIGEAQMMNNNLYVLQSFQPGGLYAHLQQPRPWPNLFGRSDFLGRRPQQYFGNS